MATPKPETILCGKIMAMIKLRTQFVEKLHGGMFQREGLPDLIVCYRGRFIAIEVKVPGKEDTATDAQVQCLKEIADAGGVSMIASSVKQVEGVLNALDIVTTDFKMGGRYV